MITFTFTDNKAVASERTYECDIPQPTLDHKQYAKDTLDGTTRWVNRGYKLDTSTRIMLTDSERAELFELINNSVSISFLLPNGFSSYFNNDKSIDVRIEIAKFKGSVVSDSDKRIQEINITSIELYE